jgi:hypothetical protein
MEDNSKVTMKVINDEVIVMVKDSCNMAFSSFSKEEAVKEFNKIMVELGYAKYEKVIKSVDDHICDGPAPY